MHSVSNNSESVWDLSQKSDLKDKSGFILQDYQSLKFIGKI